MFKDRNKLSKILLVAVVVLCAAALLIALTRCGGSGDPAESGNEVTDASGNVVTEERHDRVENGDVEMNFEDLD